MHEEKQSIVVETSNPFSACSWYRVNIDLICIGNPLKFKSYPVSIAEAMLKKIQYITASQQNETEPVFFFHIKNKKFTFKLREGETILVEVFFFKSNKNYLEKWVNIFCDALAGTEGEKRFAIAEKPEIKECNFNDVIGRFIDVKNEGEISLDFLSPLKFTHPKGKERTFINKESFINLFEKRFSKLFGTEIKYQPGDDNFSILPYYWKYSEIKRNSKSQPGTVQYINGCIGSLYIKGSFKNFLPFLILGSELHTGTKLSNSQGYYNLNFEPRGYFNSFFPDKKALLSVIRDVFERYDSAAEAAGSEINFSSENEYAEKLLNEIKEDKYNFTPNTAFVIKKKDKSGRMIEQLNPKDLILHDYLLKTISSSFNRFFEESSIGYRKGISREKAADIIQKAISGGFQYAVESDIMDFFGSIDLKILSSLLEFYIPQKDLLLKNLIIKAIRTGYILNGEYHDRIKGLAQGSPLSSILANLYLDSFDEFVEQWNVRLIRYADDFVILTRTKEEAEEMLSGSETYLSYIGLQLKKEKTDIKHINEGFKFLGITFRNSEVRIEPEEEIKRFKKPLYITEPYLFLSLNGDAIDIKKYDTIIETIPLRRISEIMLMEKTSFSSALIKKCAENNIPVTITLNSGYYVTTIKPDLKSYYDIVFLHSQKYYSLSDQEILITAKEIAAGKIKNYISLFRQKYLPGQNELIENMEETISRMYSCGSLNELRGFEGAASKKIFKNLNNFIDDDCFKIMKRDRKNPDYINSLLNFSHYLMFSRINVTIRSLGLNPYLGFLHSPENNYESLAADIQELFRSRVERFILRTINLKVITREDFVETKSGKYLTGSGIKKFIKQFESEMEKTGKDGTISLKDAVYLQTNIFKQWVLKDNNLTFYFWKI